MYQSSPLDHIDLNPFSKMKVSYATQVLSSQVANILKKYHAGTEATAEFCQYFDSFFDCVNVRNQDEGKKKRKEFLEPYRSTTDFRYDWLENVFLKYLNDWKASVETRGEEGEFSPKEREKMFLSKPTYEGLIITSKSLIETSRFVLNSGMPFFLPEKVNQDCTEEHFGRHRRSGGTKC